MKKSIKNSIMAIAVIAAFSVVLSSCNRGMGCPNNFSLETVTNVINSVDIPTID